MQDWNWSPASLLRCEPCKRCEITDNCIQNLMFGRSHISRITAVGSRVSLHMYHALRKSRPIRVYVFMPPVEVLIVSPIFKKNAGSVLDDPLGKKKEGIQLGICVLTLTKVFLCVCACTLIYKCMHARTKCRGKIFVCCWSHLYIWWLQQQTRIRPQNQQIIVSSPKQPNWQPGCFGLPVRSIWTILAMLLAHRETTSKGDLSVLSDCESEAFGLGVWVRRTKRKY